MRSHPTERTPPAEEPANAGTTNNRHEGRWRGRVQGADTVGLEEVERLREELRLATGLLNEYKN